MDKKIILVSAFFLIGILLVSIASAEFWACFDKGQEIDYCNPQVDDRTCGNSGGCIYCMSTYNSTRQCYNQGNWNICNNLNAGCTSGENSTIDTKAPILEIINPVKNGIYTSRSIWLNLTVSEFSDVAFYDNLDGRGRWTNVCSECKSYARKRSFDEGLNDLMFRAVDENGNTAYKNITFTIDSKDPSIKKTEPRSGFANGDFHIEFSEDNPVSLKLYYGNDISGRRSKQLNIGTECYLDRSKYLCDTSADLKDYDKEEIEYWYVLEDIAGNSDESRYISIDVDTTFPVLSNFLYNIDERYVTFNLTIIEENFDEITYIDNSAEKPKWLTLCSSLKKDNSCVKKRTFSEGNHDLSFQVIDEAGNSIGFPLSFDIVV